MIVLIDNGHGQNTAGKCSPDGKLKEWQKSREIARGLEDALKARGIDCKRIVEEDYDVSLAERCRRVNVYCDKYGKANVILVSIHCNAAGTTGEWKNAGGWSVYTSPGKTASDSLATELWIAADRCLKKYKEDFATLQSRGVYDQRQRPLRADMGDGDPDFEAGLYILVHTKCAAVLTESLFQDNKGDCAFLLSKEGTRAVVDLHCEGIMNYINKQKK